MREIREPPKQNRKGNEDKVRHSGNDTQNAKHSSNHRERIAIRLKLLGHLT